MQYFNFSRLVNKYSSEFTAITLVSGYYDNKGDWVDAETVELTKSGAIISYGDKTIYNSNGAITEMDKCLLSLEKIADKLIGIEFIYDENIYTIQTAKENAKFTGVWKYTMKYVSAFKKKLEGDLNDDNVRLGNRLDGVTSD